MLSGANRAFSQSLSKLPERSSTVDALVSPRYTSPSGAPLHVQTNRNYSSPLKDEVRKVYVVSGTGIGLAPAATIAEKAIKNKNEKIQVLITSRQSPEKLEKEGVQLSVEQVAPDGSVSLKKMLVNNKNFPNIHYVNPSALKNVKGGDVVMFGNSAEYMPKSTGDMPSEILPSGNHANADVVYLANGYNTATNLQMRMPEGAQVHTGAAWFNVKPDPAGPEGSKVLSKGGRYALVPENEKFRQFINETWDHDSIKLDLRPAGTGATVEMEKASANASLNTMNVLFGTKMREMLQIPGVKAVMRRVTEECAQVDLAKKAAAGSTAEPFDPEVLFKDACKLALGATTKQDFHTSSFSPFEHGDKTEINYFSGEFSRVGDAHGVPTPANTLLNAHIAKLTEARQSCASYEEFREKYKDMISAFQQEALKLGEGYSDDWPAGMGV